MASSAITFRVDDSERRELVTRAERDKVSLSGYIRVRLGLRAQGTESDDEIQDDARTRRWGSAGGADPAKGSGLRGLVDRVTALGGRLEVSSPPAEGTRLCAHLPTRAGDHLAEECEVARGAWFKRAKRSTLLLGLSGMPGTRGL